MSAVLYRLLSLAALAVGLCVLALAVGWRVGLLLHPEVRQSVEAPPAGELRRHLLAAAAAVLGGLLMRWRRVWQAVLARRGGASVVIPVALATLLLAGCGTVAPARIAVPAELGAQGERIELTGLGAGERGRTTLLGQPLSFERRATRLSLFSDLARTDRSSLQWRWDGEPGAQGECRSRRRTNSVGVIELVGRPLGIECRLTPAGATLTLAETRAATLGGISERRGELQTEAGRYAVRSLHRPQGSVLDVAQPLGYVIEDGGRAVGAVELLGTRPVLHLPAAGDPRRAQVLPALLSLALLWDESGS